MMHPANFVPRMIEDGRIDELVGMLKRFATRLRKSQCDEHRDAWWIANMMLVSVMGELHQTTSAQELDENRFLSVWKSLGFFGIERSEIALMTRTLNDPTE